MSDIMLSFVQYMMGFMYYVFESEMEGVYYMVHVYLFI